MMADTVESLTTLLHDVGDYFEHNGWSILASQELRQRFAAWWSEHQRTEAVRGAALRERALQKLTSEEIQALLPGYVAPVKPIEVQACPLFNGTPIVSSNLKTGFWLNRESGLWWSTDADGVWYSQNLNLFENSVGSVSEWWARSRWHHFVLWLQAKDAQEGCKAELAEEPQVGNQRTVKDYPSQFDHPIDS